MTLTAAIPRRLPPAAVTPRSRRASRPGYRDPAVVITAPDGTVRGEAAAAARRRGAAAMLRCAKDGGYQVEITGVGAHGADRARQLPRVLRRRAARAAPGRAGVSQGVVTAEEAERQMLALVNRDRKRAGLPPVIADATLAAIARAHSRDMVEHDFVGHVSPRTGTAMDRVRRAGLSPGLVLENVGRAYTAEEAESGFMSSPGHRANIVHPDARKLGIGIVLGAPVGGTTPLFVTQLFTN